MLLSILIPTFNRVKDLEKNLIKLENALVSNELIDVVSIIVANNQSPDNTQEFLEQFKSKTTVNIHCVHQESNIGPVLNVLSLLSAAKSEYILYLGDDDYLDPEYINRVVREIKNDKEIYCIIPSNVAISEEGDLLGYSRDVRLPTTYHQRGFRSCLENSWRGHQMSGLVFKNKELSSVLQSHSISNMYLFIYLVAYGNLRGTTLHLTDFPVKVTRPSQVKKGWNYGDDGLISHIFDNYKKLEGITAFQRARLEFKILDVQFWRFAMYIKRGPLRFIKAIWAIFRGENTSLLLKLFLPFIVPYILIKRAILLFFEGELRATMKRKVDI